MRMQQMPCDLAHRCRVGQSISDIAWDHPVFPMNRDRLHEAGEGTEPLFAEAMRLARQRRPVSEAYSRPIAG
jgi:hypothetical protein